MHLDIEELRAADSSKMYCVYDQWHDIAQRRFEEDLTPVDYPGVRHIVFAGMGGSGAISDLFASILSKTGIHVNVVKGYLLPKSAGPDSLVVCTSVSGETAETISVLEQALAAGCSTVSFSDGGRLERICAEKNIQYRRVHSVHSPRASFTAFLYTMLGVLMPILPIKRSDVTESLSEMESMREKIHSGNLSGDNPALELARWLPESPVVYYPRGLEAAAVRFKNSLQENAKLHTISEDVIEACHNGIVPWVRPTKMRPILVRGADDHIRTQERWEIIKEFLESARIEYREVYSARGSILTKLVGLIYLLDYSTIYRAAISGTDPTPVGPIDFVKKRL